MSLDYKTPRAFAAEHEESKTTAKSGLVRMEGMNVVTDTVAD